MTELWNDDGMLQARRTCDLGRQAIAELLRKTEVRFVVADCGLQLRWIPVSERFRFWKQEAAGRIAEHHTLSFEEWEDGFRRDARPEQEIALWLHAADVYAAFADREPDADRRADVYRCIVTCLTTGPDMVWQVFRPAVLSRAEAEQVVDRFYGKPTEPGAPAP
jgi:hypothetical protein